MSDLFKMAEKYIVVKESLTDKMYANHTLMAFYRKQENEKLFTESYQTYLHKTDHNSRNASYYQFISDLQYEKWQFDQVKNRFSNADADDIILHADVACISKKLMQAVVLAAQSSLIARNIDLGFIDALEVYILEKNMLKFPCISIYYYALKLIYQPDENKWFEKFSQTLEENKASFPSDEFKSLYFYAINYCIKKYNTGNKEFSGHLLEYYRTALQERYLLTNGFLSRNTYRNINTLAIRMGKFDEAMEISSQYVDSLRKEDKESAFSFNMASIYYARKQYKEALTAMQKVDFEDHLSNLFAKTLLLKIYYETRSERLLDSHLDAMQIYLTRKKIIGYHKTNYSNIVKYTRKLMRMNPYDKLSRQKLADKIKGETLLPDRDWLLNQVETSF